MYQFKCLINTKTHLEKHQYCKNQKFLFFNLGLFDFAEARTEDVNPIIKSLNPNEAPGSDLSPLKLSKATTTIVVINNNLNPLLRNVVKWSDTILKSCSNKC